MRPCRVARTAAAGLPVLVTSACLGMPRWPCPQALAADDERVPRLRVAGEIPLRPVRVPGASSQPGIDLGMFSSSEVDSRRRSGQKRVWNSPPCCVVTDIHIPICAGSVWFFFRSAGCVPGVYHRGILPHVTVPDAANVG